MRLLHDKLNLLHGELEVDRPDSLELEPDVHQVPIDESRVDVARARVGVRVECWPSLDLLGATLAAITPLITRPMRSAGSTNFDSSRPRAPLTTRTDYPGSRSAQSGQ